MPGTGAPIVLGFSDVVGSNCGAMFPTGAVQEEIDGMAVSCIDVAMPMVIIRARDLGLSGYDTDEITGNAVLRRRIEMILLEAGQRMGLGDVAESVIPNVWILAPPRRHGVVYSCYLTPHHVHAAHAVTGAICVAYSASIQTAVASEVSQPIAERVTQPTAEVIETIRVEHPSGAIDIRLEAERGNVDSVLRRAGIVLTAREIMDGQAFLPKSIWLPFPIKTGILNDSVGPPLGQGLRVAYDVGNFS